MIPSSIMAVLIYIPNSSKYPYFYSHQYLLSFAFLMTTIQVSVKWSFVKVLIFISLVISNFEHFFIYPLDICMSSLDKCLWKCFAYFKNQIFWGGYWVVWILNIFWILTTHQIYGNIFPFHSLLFHFFFRYAESL